MADTEAPLMQSFHIQLQKRVVLASLTLLVWDHALTFSDEVDHIWRHKQSPITIVFLLLRYFTFVTLVFETCSYISQGWTPETIVKLKIPPIAFVLIIFLVHLIMILRVYALYGTKIVIFAMLAFLLVIEMSIMGTALSHMTKRSRLVPGECLVVPVYAKFSPMSGVYWSAPLIEDTVVFAMTLRKSPQYSSTKGLVPLVKTFVRDGLVYYGVMCVTHVINVVLYAAGPGGIKPIAASFSHSVSTILACRLVLNLRKQAGNGNRSLPAHSHAVGPYTTDGVTQLTSFVSAEPFIETELANAPPGGNET